MRNLDALPAGWLRAQGAASPPPPFLTPSLRPHCPGCGQPLGTPKIFRGRYLACRTPASLLLADLESGRCSEVAWHPVGGTQERYCFDNPQVLAAEGSAAFGARCACTPTPRRTVVLQSAAFAVTVMSPGRVLQCSTCEDAGLG